MLRKLHILEGCTTRTSPSTKASKRVLANKYKQASTASKSRQGKAMVHMGQCSKQFTEKCTGKPSYRERERAALTKTLGQMFRKTRCWREITVLLAYLN